MKKNNNAQASQTIVLFVYLAYLHFFRQEGEKGDTILLDSSTDADNDNDDSFFFLSMLFASSFRRCFLLFVLGKKQEKLKTQTFAILFPIQISVNVSNSQLSCTQIRRTSLSLFFYIVISNRDMSLFLSRARALSLGIFFHLRSKKNSTRK